MELRVLEYFLAVAREESITGAAESLHISQPTLSRQLKDLEDELGKQLMIRGSRRITLTGEGMLLRKRAAEIIDLVNKTQEEISASDDMISGTVNIGAGETEGMKLLTHAAELLNRRYPEVHFHISSGDRTDVKEDLDKGLLDFGLVFGSTDHKKYNSIKLPYEDTWGVLMRKDSPLAGSDFIAPADLKDKPLLISRQADEDGSVSAWLGCDLRKLNLVSTYSLIFNASLMVEDGLGYAITLDRLINTSGDSSLTFIPLRPSVKASVYVIWKKYQIFSKAAGKYLDLLIEMYGPQKTAD